MLKSINMLVLSLVISSFCLIGCEKQNKQTELPSNEWRLQYNGSGKWKVKQPNNMTCFCDKKSGEAMVFETKEEAIDGAYECIKLGKKISNDYTWYDYKK